MINKSALVWFFCRGAFMAENLKTIFQDVFTRLRADLGKGGFNLAYSPEATWSENTKILILTINPQLNATDGTPKPEIPDTPYPESHAFFDPDNKFRIKRPVQGLLWELARLYEPGGQGDPLQQARDFAMRHVAMASFAPWRTVNQTELSESQWAFAAKELWGRVFAIWQPELIVAIGTQPFIRTRELFRNDEIKYGEKRIRDFQEQPQKLKKGLKLKHVLISRLKRIDLAGLPHPAAHGNSGYPVYFPDNADELSPVGRFLKWVRSER